VPTADAEIIAFADAAAFEAWLEAHVAHQPGVWLKLAKAGTGIPSLTSDEAVDVGLCFGWISGQRTSLDDRYYLQKYVPRRARSRWSLVNVRKVEALTAAGRMRPAGSPRCARPRPTAAGTRPTPRNARPWSPTTWPPVWRRLPRPPGRSRRSVGPGSTP
jgi:uncharacterized protein YdeI (YjbR/CyaY-like superfamily)